MSREIKFRAWDGRVIINHHWRDSTSQVHDLWQFVVGIDTDCELMQYTGLKDKNGKEIYEGDVCKRLSSNGTKEQVCYGTIEFHKGSFCFKREHSNLRIAVDNICYHYADCEIIGNIYENPELLTQK